MHKLSEHGEKVRDALTREYDVSADAARSLMDAVTRGGGRQAQFNHPDLGGMGQWSSGGMTMVGDMFNTGLQHRVASMCAKIAAAASEGSFYAGDATGRDADTDQTAASISISGRGAGWWPDTLGEPSATGSQNALAYAIFPSAERLAVNLNGRVTVYDTGEHRIGGISQRQSGDSHWTFTSQKGTVDLSRLKVVAGAEDTQTEAPKTAAPEPAPETPVPSAHTAPPQGKAPAGESGDIFEALEKLGALRDRGVITEEDFASKKAELLARL